MKVQGAATQREGYLTSLIHHEPDTARACYPTSMLPNEHATQRACYPTSLLLKSEQHETAIP